VRGISADGLVVNGCIISGQTDNGIFTSDSDDVVVDGNRVSAVPGRGSS